MSFPKYYEQEHVTQISTKEIKSRLQLQGARNHNDRCGSEADKMYIDKRRTYLNQDLLPEGSQEDIYTNLINRISGKEYTKDTVPSYPEDVVRYADGRKLKSDTKEGSHKYDVALAFETECRYPGDLVWCRFNEKGEIEEVPDGTEITKVDIYAYGEVVKDDVTGVELLDENGNKQIGKGYFRMPVNKNEFDEWCKSTADWHRDRFCSDNVVSCKLHMDEGFPHIHTIVTPVVVGKTGELRLSYNEMIGKAELFNGIQQSYAEALAHLNYKAPPEHSLYSNKIDVRHWKAGLNEKLSEELPDTLEKAHSMLQEARVKIYDLEVKNKEIMPDARKFRKVRLDKDRLTAENKELKEENKRLENTIQLQREELRLYENREKCLKHGLEIHEPQIESDAYKIMDTTLTEQGYNHYIELGADPEEIRYTREQTRTDGNDRSQTQELS